MIHVMRIALFLAPVTNIGAQFAYLFGKGTIAGDCISAQSTNCGTLDAAGWAVILALHPDHVCEAVAALGRAEITGIDAVFGELVHRVIHAGLLLLSKNDPDQQRTQAYHQ